MPSKARTTHSLQSGGVSQAIVIRGWYNLANVMVLHANKVTYHDIFKLIVLIFHQNYDMKGSKCFILQQYKKHHCLHNIQHYLINELPLTKQIMFSPYISAVSLSLLQRAEFHGPVT